MPDGLVLRVLDKVLSPRKWYRYDQLVIDGFCLIATKEDQKNAGLSEEARRKTGERAALRERKFGMNPIKPYRDYYGRFQLYTRLTGTEVEVKFALGYTINTKITTVDDYSSFSWLRLATGIEGIYPNLSAQKQLLEYLLNHSRHHRFIVTRIYHYLQFELYRELARMILEKERQMKA